MNCGLLRLSVSGFRVINEYPVTPVTDHYLPGVPLIHIKGFDMKILGNYTRKQLSFISCALGEYVWTSTTGLVQTVRLS